MTPRIGRRRGANDHPGYASRIADVRGRGAGRAHTARRAAITLAATVVAIALVFGAVLVLTRGGESGVDAEAPGAPATETPAAPER
ncbi:MAG: hypothetical protein ACR2NA_09950 [Solirubrobacterales bacterium]